MSGSFESMRWNACEYRLDLGLYSHPKDERGGGGGGGGEVEWSHNPCYLQGKYSSTRKNLLRGT